MSSSGRLFLCHPRAAAAGCPAPPVQPSWGRIRAGPGLRQWGAGTGVGSQGAPRPLSGSGFQPASAARCPVPCAGDQSGLPAGRSHPVILYRPPACFRRLVAGDVLCRPPPYPRGKPALGPFADGAGVDGARRAVFCFPTGSSSTAPVSGRASSRGQRWASLTRRWTPVMLCWIGSVTARVCAMLMPSARRN